jgi:hypothetical protein
MFSQPCVMERPSRISVPGARAMVLDEGCAAGEATAFMIGREFAHLHPQSDGSLHMALPLELVHEAIEAGWAEHHPVALRGMIPMTIVMVYGPRDEAELEVIKRLVQASLAFARGES